MELTIHYRVNFTSDPIIVRMKNFRTARLTVPLYVGICETRFRWKTSPLCGKNIFIKAGKIVSGHVYFYVYVFNPIRPSFSLSKQPTGYQTRPKWAHQTIMPHQYHAPKMDQGTLRKIPLYFQYISFKKSLKIHELQVVNRHVDHILKILKKLPFSLGQYKLFFKSVYAE